jgi:hypothetical protein
MTESMSFALPITALSAGQDTLSLAWHALAALSVPALLAAAAAVLRRRAKR